MLKCPRWAGRPFTVSTTRCRILWFRVLLTSALVAGTAVLSLRLLAGDPPCSRTSIHILTQQAYIADYELSSSGMGLIVAELTDPIIESLEPGNQAATQRR